MTSRHHDAPDGRILELATMAGVEPFYWGIEGDYHETSSATARAILGALGIAAGSDAEVEASLSMLAEAPWRRVLPPVAVVWEGSPAAVTAHVPAGTRPQHVRWRIVQEIGARRPPAATGGGAPGAAEGETRSIDGRLVQRFALRVPGDLPPGYHQVVLEEPVEAVMPFIVAPPSCELPAAVAGAGRAWGIAAQLYALRSARNWGAGDFGDLKDLAGVAVRLGASAIGINPLHALLLDDPQRASPYSPSSRYFLNPLYLDVEAIADLAGCPEARALIADPAFAGSVSAARRERLVPWGEVARLKLEVLGLLYERFRRGHLARDGDPRAVEFRRFQAAGGDRLRRLAVFEALREHHGGISAAQWPAGDRRPSAAAVSAVARQRLDRVEFFEYLQWQADAQLAAAAAAARHGGAGLGLYRDLAVSIAADGADAWGEPDLYVAGARIGAPADAFNPIGQDWGLPPMHPGVLREVGYAPFIDLLRANMRHAGALRIDHVMGLARQFWVPAGAAPGGGAYVRYPMEALLGILALESRRHRCLVIGEDLGTVPEGFRPAMAARNVLSCRVLYFEQSDDGRFRRPAEYPRLAAASASTHDLPTVKGYWTGADLDLRRRLGLGGSARFLAHQEAQRRADRAALLAALAGEQLLPPGAGPENPGTVSIEDLIRAVHGFLGRSAACLVMVQADDLAAEADPINVPGTVREYPNWRRKLSVTLEDLAGSGAVRELAEAMARERGGGGGGGASP